MFSLSRYGNCREVIQSMYFQVSGADVAFGSILGLVFDWRNLYQAKHNICENKWGRPASSPSSLGRV
jgi:hypothetical protein